MLSVVSDRHCLAQGWGQSCALAGLGRVGQLQLDAAGAGTPSSVVVVASGHLSQCGQCQGVAMSSGQPASTGTLDNLVGSHQFMPEKELHASQCNYSCWKALEGINHFQENKKSRG